MVQGRAAGRNGAFGAVVLAVLALPCAAGAATIDVNTPDDVLNPADGRCSLREAVRAANLDAASGSGAGECPAGGPSDLVRVPAGGFQLALAGPGEDAAATGDLDLSGTVQIIGAGTAPGATGTDLSGLIDRVFHVQPGATVTVSNLRIRNGKAPNGTQGSDVTGGPGANGTGTAGGAGADGGGILNAGTLTLANVVVANNAAGSGGGGGFGQGGDGGAGVNGGSGTGGAGGRGGNGGAIHTTGPLDIRDSTITSNSGGNGTGGGTGLGGQGGTGAPNGGNGGSAHGGNGGPGGTGGIGVAADGSLTMTASVVSNNTGGAGGQGGGTQNGRGGDATANGNGGIGAPNQSGFGGAGAAGGIGGAGAMTISTSAITANKAGDGGNASGSLTGAGGNGSGTGDGGPGGNGLGGTGGAGGSGGGLNASGPLTISRSLVAGNSAGKGGNAGSDTGAGGGTAGGGAGSTAGAPGAGAGGVGGTGGFGGGLRVVSGTPSIVNVTLDANIAGSGGEGGQGLTFQGFAQGGNGGIGASGGNASLPGGTMTHITMTGGTAGGGGEAGAAISFGGPASGGGAGTNGAAGVAAGLSAGGPPGVTATNSIFSDGGCGGTVNNGGRNIRFNNNLCPGTLTDPKLGPLANNGGPTQTRRLLAGSPALDGVPAAGAGCALSDQRGAVRPFGPACDIGAFEVAPPAAATGAAQAVATTTATVTGTVTPRGLSTTHRFEFGETTAYGQTTATASSASATPVGVAVGLSGLKPATTYHYRFLAQGPDGQATGADATFTTQDVPPPPLAKPNLTALTVSPARFRVARGATARTGARRPIPRGTRISYRLSLAARVRLSIQRAGLGVKVRRRGRTVCVAASRARFRRTPRRRRCTVFRTRGTLTRSGVAGLNRVRFTGRIGRRALPAGSYRVVALAQNAAGRSASRRKAFRIVASRR